MLYLRCRASCPIDNTILINLNIYLTGIPIDTLLDEMKTLKSQDPVIEPQKVFTDVFYPGESPKQAELLTQMLQGINVKQIFILTCQHQPQFYIFELIY